MKNFGRQEELVEYFGIARPVMAVRTSITRLNRKISFKYLILGAAILFGAFILSKLGEVFWGVFFDGMALGMITLVVLVAMALLLFLYWRDSQDVVAISEDRLVMLRGLKRSGAGLKIEEGDAILLGDVEQAVYGNYIHEQRLVLRTKEHEWLLVQPRTPNLRESLLPFGYASLSSLADRLKHDGVSLRAQRGAPLRGLFQIAFGILGALAPILFVFVKADLKRQAAMPSSHQGEAAVGGQAGAKLALPVDDPVSKKLQELAETANAEAPFLVSPSLRFDQAFAEGRVIRYNFSATQPGQAEREALIELGRLMAPILCKEPEIFEVMAANGVIFRLSVQVPGAADALYADLTWADCAARKSMGE